MANFDQLEISINKKTLALDAQFMALKEAKKITKAKVDKFLKTAKTVRKMCTDIFVERDLHLAETGDRIPTKKVYMTMKHIDFMLDWTKMMVAPRAQ